MLFFFPDHELWDIHCWLFKQANNETCESYNKTISIWMYVCKSWSWHKILINSNEFLFCLKKEEKERKTRNVCVCVCICILTIHHSTINLIIIKTQNPILDLSNLNDVCGEVFLLKGIEGGLESEIFHFKQTFYSFFSYFT